MSMPTFDWSINFGHFLTIIVLGGGGIGFVWTIRGRVDALSERMLSLEYETKKLVDVLIAQGRQDERLTAMDQRMVAQGRRLDELAARFNRTSDKD
jgi:hypothetical protein